MTSGSSIAEAPLAKLCALVTDGTHDTPRVVLDGFPLIKAKEIVGGRIDFDSCDSISLQDHKKVIARSKPERGDTLFAHIGASLGEAAYVDTDREFSIKNIALFKPNPAALVGRYLYYLIVGPVFQDAVKAVRTGSAQPFLSLGQLRTHKVRYHQSLRVQEKIAAILSAYDDLIENNNRRIRILEEMAQRIYREWFVDFRYPGHESVPLVESELGPVPEGWRIAKLADRFRVVLGGTPSRAVARYWSGGTVPWINSGRVNDLRVLEGSELITPEALKHSNAKMMPRGTTVVAITGATLGQVSLLEIEACANQSVVGVYDPDGQLSEYVYLTIKVCIERIIGAASGGAQQHINQKIVRDTVIPVPPPALVERFRVTVEPLFTLLGGLLRTQGRLRQARDLLLPRLVSGEIDVADLDVAVPEVAA